MNKLSIFFKTLLFLLLTLSIVGAQEACEALLETAFEQTGINCSGTERNELCYGFSTVDATFTGNASIAATGDTASVEELISVQSSELDTASDEWGIAALNIQANVPSTLADAKVALVLLGDAEIENAVAADEAYVPTEGVEVLVNVASGGNVRFNPNTNSNIAGGAGHQSTWLADALSADRQWVRIVYEGQLRWLSRIVLASDPAIDELPVVGSDLPPTYMQSFYLRTSTETSPCEDTPTNMLVVQSPDDLETDLTINGVDISMSSSGALRFVEIDSELFLEIIVFEGEFNIGNVTIFAGQHSYLCIGDEDSFGLDGEANDHPVTCDPTSPEIYTPTDALCALEQLPAGILNEPLNVLCPGEVIGDNPIVDTGDPIGCEDFRIVTTTIVNGNFTLQWTPVEGATRYEISTVDENGRELALLHSNSASLFTNGGANFPPAGYVDVRAFNGDEYLCYARLDYQRVDSTVSGPAPSTSLSGASPSCVSGGTYSVTIINDVPCTITGTFAGNAFNIAPGGSQGFSVPGGNQTLIVNSCPGFAGTTASYCIDTDSAITVYVP